MVFVLTLVITSICTLLGYYGTNAPDFSSKAASALIISGIIFFFILACFLIYMMMGVNEQLSLFFKQVGVRIYPRRSIAALVLTQLLIFIQYAVVLVLSLYIEISYIYDYLSKYLNIMM